ncbi:hypothetical protein F5876DRAFT_82587 [Lentinula aff. lateritia]|uniref:Uncharacterized protein n=1 Tax=Lentinula aff. lateritia TaxID=2804960 RepID=A0ACC1TJK9_9AGAR|nr:hypothetical protein F5876DRAFT_82587 [Lentinula aff. lateritia]
MTNSFLILIADSVYDCGSPSLLFCVGSHLSHSWWDIVVFEARIVKSVSAGEGVSGEGEAEGEDSRKADQVRRLRNGRIALLRGGLIIGLSVRLLAPVINVGLRTAFSTVGLVGISRFLVGSAGAAVIATRITGKVTFSSSLPFLYLNRT